MVQLKYNYNLQFSRWKSHGVNSVLRLKEFKKLHVYTLFFLKFSERNPDNIKIWNFLFKGWHSVDEPMMLPDDFGREYLVKYAPYLSRITAIMKHSKNYVMNCLTDEDGQNYMKWLFEVTILQLKDFVLSEKNPQILPWILHNSFFFYYLFHFDIHEFMICITNNHVCYPF